VTMTRGLAPKTEGRRGSQRRLAEGGRYLGIPGNGHSVAPTNGHEGVDDHNFGLLSVQETVSMKTRGGPPDTAVRSAVRHGVIPQGAPIIRRMGRTARWDPTTLASMFTVEIRSS